MKHLSAGQLALSFTGVFLGAGFVSGQELWQFFACFGPVGLVGFLLTVGIIFIINFPFGFFGIIFICIEFSSTFIIPRL